MKFKRIIAVSFSVMICAAPVFAQLTAEQRIEDSIIGWWSNPRFDHLKPQTDPTGKKKEFIVNKLVEWMKKTYTPVGGLGTFNRFINKSNFRVSFAVWDVSHDKMWTETNGNFKPIAEQNTAFYISVNKMYGAFDIPFLNSDGAHFFTMQPDGYLNTVQTTERINNTDPRIHPNAYKYITWVNEWQTVYLAPGNKLPFAAITKAELLTKAEDGLAKQWDNEIKAVEAQWPGNKKVQEEALVPRKKNIDNYRGNIQKLRERYQNSLNEPAVIRDMQPTMTSFSLDPDPFKIDNSGGNLKQAFPVYKIDAALAAKMQSDTPQWIAIAFPYETKENGTQLNELHTALAENFNYEYVYNYFFNPGKVKDIEYKPANEEQLKARLDNYRRRNKAAINPGLTKVALPANVFFFEDFSGSSVGAAPANWFFKRYGKHAVVTTVKDQPGKWLEMGFNNAVAPLLLKKPFPENFTLEFDVLTSAGYEGRTGGAVVLSLNSRPSGTDGAEDNSGTGTAATIEIVAGNEANYESNYRGVLKIKINASPSLNKEHYTEGIAYEYPLREFTNKKTKIHVAVKVQSGILSVLINNKQAAISTNFKMTYGGNCVTCGIATGTKFNAIFWKNTTDDAGNIQVYTGNIKMVKE